MLLFYYFVRNSRNYGIQLNVSTKRDTIDQFLSIYVFVLFCFLGLFDEQRNNDVKDVY